ncbi:hypothetical protein H2199_007760 [Coniosporium tulheliwenetii]|uniref:Uncharacterized protein n=1 Tax=Coniosporium tulheliwenetii TaxID=3383036 RepID=A0ACC2YNH0_9PEZI|nr:hypothetical protein H2199_007760 [Cladosporium sp. JES 115]
MQPLQSIKAPFIVDDDCDISEQIVLLSDQDHDGECLGAADLAAYSSMSEYGKAQENYPLYDYVATRPDQESAYAGFALPSAASQYSHVQTPVSHGPSTVPQAPFISSVQYDTHDLPYQAPFPFIDASSRHLPEVTRYLPTQGLHGKLRVYIRTNQDVSTPGPLFFSIMFGRRRCDAALTKIDQRGPYFQYALTVDIPPFETTGWHDSQVPLFVQMEDENGQSLGVVEVGDFMYTDGSNYQAYEPPADGSRKRKLSDESVDEVQSPPKRVASHTLQGRPQQLSGADRSSQGITLPASPYPSSATPSTYGFSDTYGRPQQQHSAYGQNMSPRLSYQYPSPAVSRASVIAQSPRISAYSPYSRASHLSRSPATAPVQAISRSRVATSPASLTNPPLIRTSTLQPPPTPAVPATVSSQSFNPYAMYPNSKAVLEIKGELDRMAEGWSPDEWDAKRRLVQFRRDQSGSTITTSFEAVSPETRAPNSICISCIWWEEKQECYVTSVDTIYLLESLVAVRFTVEEKNRIRRNLEGFRPLTVSKAKAGSEPFFKIIMGFSNPKPRNIEKDVKVFPWKMLPLALKKIISKYVGPSDRQRCVR